MIGHRDVGGPVHWDGRIDEVGFWKRVLTARNRSQLYNNGFGSSCGIPVPAMPPTLPIWGLVLLAAAFVSSSAYVLCSRPTR